jgi:hypothetical protein
MQLPMLRPGRSLARTTARKAAAPPRCSRSTADSSAAAAAAAAAEPPPPPTQGQYDYARLALLADARSSVHVGATRLGRGLVSPAAVGRQALVSVPIHNALVVSDSPSDSISIFADRQQREWQEQHGQLPDRLLEFLQGAWRAPSPHQHTRQACLAGHRR